MNSLESNRKAAMLGLTILISIENSFSQGSFVFDNGIVNIGPRAAIFGPDPVNPHRQQWGNTPDARVPGTQVYGGAPLAGITYSVQAWYSLTPVADVFQLAGSDPVSGPPGSFNLVPGYFGGGERAVPGALVNTNNVGWPYYAYLQVRVWDNAGGQLATWDEAWNAALAGSGRAVGWSEVFYQGLTIGAQPRPGMENFESFNIFIIPEPGTVSLIALGGAALLWSVRLRQRKQP